MLLNNRYQILKTLGRGGFGETYLAEDTNMPSGRKCVIKQLKPIVQRPQIPQWTQERFQREAAILEELGEENRQIPRLYAYFSENKQFYLVQEWIEGETLTQKWQREGNLSCREIKNILIKLLPVLDYIHSRRIVHRDLKPDNIIIQAKDSLPVLIDFGAVKEAMATTAEHHNSSALSASIGTPGYMPSEQAAGRPLYSSDLYSLGLTAIFLLTGKSPQELEVDSQTGEIIWHQYAEAADPNLLAILDKAIRFHPRDRYATAPEMLTALQPQTNYQGVTRATVKVAPAAQTYQKFNGTVAYPQSVPQQQPRKNNNWLGKILLLFLITGTLGIGTLVIGVTEFFNNLSSRREPSTPQVKVEPSQPNPTPPPDREEIIKPTNPEETSIIEKIIAATKPKKVEPSEKKVTEPEIEASEIPPEVVIETRPQPQKPQPQPEPEPEPEPEREINIPIVTTGSSESQLVSTLGKPTSERNDWRENSRILVYQDAVPDRVNLSYRSDSSGKIRQTDIALNQSLTLGAMQDTLAQMLGGNAPVAVKEKLRRVYNRQDDLSFFQIGNLEGKVQRDSKDRVNISVWETGY
ncbi:MAG TPA: protein kinase [Xenococcaceae cyanobacterium]